MPSNQLKIMHSALCIQWLSNNDFLCRAVGVADDADLASLGIVDSNALQVVIAFDGFCLSVSLNTFNASLYQEFFPNCGRFVLVNSLVPNI